MAASIVIPARTRVRPDRGAVARTVARTAPRGPGLAPVLALPLRGVAAGDGRLTLGPVPTSPATVATPGAPTLRLVTPPQRRGLRIGRRAIAVVVGALLAVVLIGAARGVLAQPEEPVAAGHVVLAPGETLWDIAVRSAPAGVDPRVQLDALRRLNGFGSATLDAWTVVLIPAA